jgi:hypothetical protein
MYRIIEVCGGKMKRSIVTNLLLVLISLHVLASSQEKPTDRSEAARGASSYKLDLLLSESENGKRINTRNYSFVVEERKSVRLRQGLRVPVSVGASFQYMDVGLNIDCDLIEVDTGVHINLSVDESSFSAEQQRSVGGNPVMRQFKNQVQAVIPTGKQTLVSSVEELDSKKRVDIELTATKLR